jgi:hypothetical protein
MRDINIHYDLDAEKRADFHHRYLFVALWMGHPWWEELDAELSKEERGKSSEEEGGMPETAKWVAEFSDKTGRIFAHFLSNLEVIEEVNAKLEGDAHKIEGFLRTLYRFDTRLKTGQIVTKAMPKGSRVHKITIDFDKGEILIKGEAEVEKAGPFRFLTEVKKVKAEDLKGAKEIVHRKKMYKKARETRMVREMEVEAPLSHPKSFPPWLEAVGALFAFTLDIVNLSRELKEKDGIEVWANFVHDGLIATDTLANALKVSMTLAKKDTEWIKTFAKYGEYAKGVGLPLEAFLNLREGCTIMFIAEESPAYAALKKDEVLIGKLEYLRGFALVSSSASGLALGAYAAFFAEGAAFAAFLGPLGVALAIGGLIAIGFCVAVYLLTGPDSSMKGLQDELDKAIDKEFGETGNRYAAGYTPDALERFRKDMDVVLQDLTAPVASY